MNKIIITKETIQEESEELVSKGNHNPWWIHISHTNKKVVGIILKGEDPILLLTHHLILIIMTTTNSWDINNPVQAAILQILMGKYCTLFKTPRYPGDAI